MAAFLMGVTVVAVVGKALLESIWKLSYLP